MSTRTVGPVTASASLGSAIGGSLVVLVNELFSLGLSDTGLAAATTLAAALVAILAGYLTPDRLALIEDNLPKTGDTLSNQPQAGEDAPEVASVYTDEYLNS